MTFDNKYQKKTFCLESDLLNKMSYFWSPDYLEPTAWAEHIPFAFWLIETFKPKSIIELGVFRGTSYFSFCQAVAALNIPSVCYGIDTWEGDEHTGFYTEEFYKTVTSFNERYIKFSTLIRSTFDEANPYFLDESVDLLHIDGYHTYNEVKCNFEKWYPKLSKNAIVLFHDINVRERNFGVFRLWDEITKDKFHFQFDFGHGLGVLAIGNSYPEELMELFTHDQSSPVYLFLRNLFADRGKLFKQHISNIEKTQEVESLRMHSQSLELTIQSVNENNQLLQQQLNESDVENEKLQNQLNELKESYAMQAVIPQQEYEKLQELKEINNTLAEEVSKLHATTEFNNSGNYSLQLQKIIIDTRKRIYENENFLPQTAAFPLRRLIIRKPQFAFALARFLLIILWGVKGKLGKKKHKIEFWKSNPHVPYALINDYILVKKSGLFNEQWYLTEYPDVKEKKADPILHYITAGFYEGRNPDPDFNTNDYYNQHNDVISQLLNPLIHYLKQEKP